jgi:hypothetical protein
MYTLLLFCLIQATLLFPVRGAEYIVAPSLELRETYDDNVYYRNVDDFEHRISPALALGIRTETAEAQTDVTVKISEYQNNNELSTVDEYYNFSGTLLPHPRLQLGLSGNYIRDHTFTSALEEAGIVAERKRRTSARAQPSLVMAITERDRVEFLYLFNNTEYSYEDYPDYYAHYLSLAWIHALLNERTSLFLQTNGGRIDFDLPSKDGTQEVVQGIVGVAHQLSETLQASIKAGVSYTRSKYPKTEVVFVPPIFFTTRTTTEKDTDITYLLDGVLNWRLERFKFSLEVKRDLYPSIFGELVTRDRINGTLQYSWTEKFSSRLWSSYIFSETDGLNRKEKQETFYLRPSLNYRLGDHSELLVGYDFTRSRDKVAKDTDHRNRVFIELRVAWEGRY